MPRTFSPRLWLTFHNHFLIIEREGFFLYFEKVFINLIKFLDFALDRVKFNGQNFDHIVKTFTQKSWCKNTIKRKKKSKLRKLKSLFYWIPRHLMISSFAHFPNEKSFTSPCERIFSFTFTISHLNMNAFTYE